MPLAASPPLSDANGPSMRDCGTRDDGSRSSLDGAAPRLVISRPPYAIGSVAVYWLMARLAHLEVPTFDPLLATLAPRSLDFGPRHSGSGSERVLAGTGPVCKSEFQQPLFLHCLTEQRPGHSPSRGPIWTQF